MILNDVEKEQKLVELGLSLSTIRSLLHAEGLWNKFEEYLKLMAEESLLEVYNQNGPEADRARGKVDVYGSLTEEINTVIVDALQIESDKKQAETKKENEE